MRKRSEVPWKPEITSRGAQYAPKNVPAQTPQTKPAGRIASTVPALAIVLIALLLFVIVAGARANADDGIPDDMVGVWTTDNPTYADRSFEITPTTLTIQTAVEEFTSNSIDRVQREGSGESVLYTVYYTAEDREAYELSFYFTAHSGGKITFKNQPGITWHKRDQTEPPR